MNQRETVALARAAFAALEEIPGATTAHAYAMDGERRHRRSGDFGRYHPAAASKDVCAALFVARWLAGYALRPETLPNLAAVGRMRPDAVKCASIVAEHGPDKILYALRAANLDPAAVAALDYVTALGKARP